MTTQEDSPEKLFGEISEFITESRRLLHDGAVMELAGLDVRVARLCRAVLGLSQEERAFYAERMQVLFDELDVLGMDLGKHRDAVAEKIVALPDRKKAVNAYHTADAVDNFGNPKKTDG